MHILRVAKKLDWGDLSLPVWGLDTDWLGQKREKPLMYSLADDGEKLWFVAASSMVARMHPQARPGHFLGEMWKYDVAEFFLADPVSGRYIEFHLSANSAWWSGEFVSPRELSENPLPFPEVETYAEIAKDGGWMSAMSIPIDLLQSRVAYRQGIKANVCFISNSPEQKFYSAVKLPGEHRNFHQPAYFTPVTFTDWAE